jgi:glycosyltransferase involved in cell wall biosynthesis
MRVSFIVPVFNEAATVGEVLERVASLDLDKQIVVVDDGSVDATPSVLAAWEGRDGVLVLRQSNRGKGAAIRAAIPHVDGDVVVIQDADMEYDPTDVPALLEPIERGVADVVYGSRLSGGRPQRAYLFWHLVGNRFLSLLTTFEPEITAQVCKRRLRVYELPISYYGRTYAEGKKITWRDGVKAVWVLLRVRLGR